MSKKNLIVSIAYDFDGTLAPGNMQEHSFLPKLGIDPEEFWAKTKKMAEENDMDEILAYMQLMISESKNKSLPIRKKDFEKFGRGIKFFKGVEGYFDRINSYAKEKGIIVEHYIISSGLREFVHGTKISKQFKNIFASGFKYDINGVAEWPALAINYTNKTQYLFRINKGITTSYDNSLINKYIPEKKKPVSFDRMVYIGDGETDIPAMKMIKYKGGTAIAVYNPYKRKEKTKKSPRKICADLLLQGRADFIAPADYSEGSRLDQIVKSILDKIEITYRLRSLGKS
ncbi:MAG: haloacid dehalogenase-like hydrolase [Bacteroidales bacterium]|nr:haloacid dehalogenase-like hydrolase [Bacteroidales bacterium]